MAYEELQSGPVILALELLVLTKYGTTRSVEFDGLEAYDQSINDQLILIGIVEVKIIVQAHISTPILYFQLGLLPLFVFLQFDLAINNSYSKV